MCVCGFWGFFFGGRGSGGGGGNSSDCFLSLVCLLLSVPMAFFRYQLRFVCSENNAFSPSSGESRVYFVCVGMFQIAVAVIYLMSIIKNNKNK